MKVAESCGHLHRVILRQHEDQISVEYIGATVIIYVGIANGTCPPCQHAFHHQLPLRLLSEKSPQCHAEIRFIDKPLPPINKCILINGDPVEWRCILSKDVPISEKAKSTEMLTLEAKVARRATLHP
jgi:hypothetical protein